MYANGKFGKALDVQIPALSLLLSFESQPALGDCSQPALSSVAKALPLSEGPSPGPKTSWISLPNSVFQS